MGLWATQSVHNMKESSYAQNLRILPRRRKSIPLKSCSWVSILLFLQISLSTAFEQNYVVESAFVPCAARSTSTRISSWRQTQLLRSSQIVRVPMIRPDDRDSSHTNINTNERVDSELELDRYNDDAFGLVFLAGGLISKDVYFAATFLALSAVASSATYAGIIKADSRVAGAVALLTLIISPIVMSHGSLNGMVAPLPIEICVCGVSILVAIFNSTRSGQR